MSISSTSVSEGRTTSVSTSSYYFPTKRKSPVIYRSNSFTILISLLLVLSPFFFSSTSTVFVNGSWTGSNNNAAHQSVLFDQVSNSLTPFRPWTISLDSYTSNCPSTFSISDDLVFISTNSSVLAFSATNGRLIWARTSLVTSRYETVSSPTIVSLKSILLVMKMRKTKGNISSSFPELSTNENIDHGLVFVGAENCLYALSEHDGTTIWKYCSSRVTISLHTQPTVDEFLGIVVTAVLVSGEPDDLEDSGARLLGFDMFTGKLLWDVTILENKLAVGDHWIDMRTPGITIHPVSERVYSSWILTSERTNDETLVIASHQLRTGRTMYEYITRSSDFNASSTLAVPSEFKLEVGIPSVDLQGFAYVPTNKGVVSLDVQGELRWRFIPTQKIVLKKSSLIPSSVTSEEDRQGEDDDNNNEVGETTGEEETETILVKGSLLTLHPPVLNEQDQVAYLPTLSKEIYTLNLRDGQLYSLPTPFDSVILPSNEEGKLKPFGSETQVLSYHPSKRTLFAGGRTLETFRLNRDGQLITPKTFSSSSSSSSASSSLSYSSTSDLLADSSSWGSHFNSVRVPIAVEEERIYFISSHFHDRTSHTTSSSSSSTSSSFDFSSSSSVRRKNCQLEARKFVFSSTSGSSSSTTSSFSLNEKKKQKRRIG